MQSAPHKPLPENLPQPSYAPALMAAGLTCLLWGVVTSWMVSAVGLILAAGAAVLWIGDFGVKHPLESAIAVAQDQRESRPTVPKSAPLTAASPWLHRYITLLAASTLVLVIAGAGATSRAGRAWEITHLAVAVTVGVLTLGLALWLRARIGWVLLAAVIVQAVLGSRAPAVAVFHAFLAQLFFATMAAIAVATSSAWKRDPEIANDMAKPSLRMLGIVTVALVIVQVALGAAVRHKVMGSGVHITGALVVALAIVVLGVLVMNQCPTHATLRPTAIAMMIIAGAQVFLGFAAFIVRMMADENTLPVTIPTMAHVTTGALTLAATVILTMEMHRHLRPPVRK